MVHCESIDLSVSLDVLSPSKEQILLFEALLFPLPFNPEGKRLEEITIAAQVSRLYSGFE
jgi:hypothetical protein